MLFKKLLLVAVLVFVFLFQIASVKAEDGLMQTVPADTVVSQNTSVIADVNVGDVTVQTREDGVEGSFSLAGRLGQQNDIVYGILVTDTENKPLSATILGRVDSLQEAEVRKLAFTYSFPSSLNGKTILWLYAETQGGVPLGRQKVAEKDFGIKNEAHVSCAVPENNGKFSCVSEQDTELDITYHKESYFGIEAGVEKVRLAAGREAFIEPKLTAGSYVAFVHSSAGDTMLSFRVPGTASKIANILIYKSQSGEDAATGVAAVSHPVKNLQAKLVLKSGEMRCGETTVDVTGAVAEFSLSTMCQSGTVAVTLIDATGSILDTIEQSFSLEKFTPQKSTETVSEQVSTQGDNGQKKTVIFTLKRIGYGILFLIVVAAVFFRSRTLFRRAGAAKITLFFVTSVGMFGAVHQAHALTLSTTQFYLGEVAVSSYAEITSDKSSYAPGDTMTLSTTYTFEKDAPLGAAYKTVATVGYFSGPIYDVDIVGTQSLPAWGYVEVPFATMSYSGTVVGPYNAAFAIPGGISAGNHFISLRLVINVRNNAGADLAWSMDIGRLNFSIAAPPVPTVTLSPFSPATITAGSTSSISFSSTNATSCTGSGIWNGNLGGTSNPGISTPTMAAGTYTQSVTCSGPGGSATSPTRILQVNPAVAPPTATISANGPVAYEAPSWWQKAVSMIAGSDMVAHAGSGAIITVGENAALTWSSTGASNCTISGNGISRTDLNFSNYVLTGLPTGVFTYTINCSNVAGTASDSTTITVNPPRVDGFCAPTHYNCIAGTVRLDGDTATTYNWTCMGSGGGLNSSPCTEAIAAVVPGVPASLSANPGACGSGAINISWNSVAGATSYQLRDGGTQIYSGAASSFNHTGLVAGSAHSYTVRATNASGSSSWSGIISASAPNACAATTINGVCGVAAETCTSGIYANSPADTAANYQWTCLGAGSPVGTDSGTCTAPTPTTYTITATAGSGGFISPSGSVSGIVAGSSRTFTITPGFPYEIDTVTINTGSGPINIGAPSSYTFNNITSNGSIHVTFRAGTTSGITQAQGCTISAGNSTCTGRVSWTTAGDAVPPIELSVSGTTYSSNNPAASNQPVAIDYGSHVVTLRDQGGLFEQATMTAVCFGTLIWNQGICQASGGMISAWPTNCTIPVGQSTCDVNFTWWTQNLATASIYNVTRNIVYSTALSGTAVPFSIGYGNNTVRLRDAALATRDSVTVRGNCAGVWNATLGVCEAGLPSATITTGACAIPNGASTCNIYVAWTSSNLTKTPSVQQDGIEFSTATSAIPGSVSRPITHVSAGGNTFTFVHDGTILNTKSVGATCAVSLFWTGTRCSNVCVPTDNCANHTSDTDNVCVGSQYTIANDGCGNSISCPGTRSCDYNWKEVAP